MIPPLRERFNLIVDRHEMLEIVLKFALGGGFVNLPSQHFVKDATLRSPDILRIPRHGVAVAAVLFCRQRCVFPALQRSQAGLRVPRSAIAVTVGAADSTVSSNSSSGIAATRSAVRF